MDAETRYAMQYVTNRLSLSYSASFGDFPEYMASGLVACFLEPLGFGGGTGVARQVFVRSFGGKTPDQVARASSQGASGFAAIQGSVEEHGHGGISDRGRLSGTRRAAIDNALESYVPGSTAVFSLGRLRRVDMPVSERTVVFVVASELIRAYTGEHGELQRYLRHGLLEVAYDGFGIAPEGGNAYANAARFVAENCQGTPDQVKASLESDERSAAELLDFAFSGTGYSLKSYKTSTGNIQEDARVLAERYAAKELRGKRPKIASRDFRTV